MTRSSQTEYERVAGVLEACADAEKRLGGHPYRAKIMRRSAELLRRADVLLRTPRGEGEADAYHTHGEVTWCSERINDDDVEYVRAPASGEPSGADAAVREALDAIKKAHAAVDDLCNGRRWTMSIPARPDADHDLVIDNALTKAERVIRSLTDVPAGE